MLLYKRLQCSKCRSTKGPQCFGLKNTETYDLYKVCLCCRTILNHKIRVSSTNYIEEYSNNLKKDNNTDNSN